MPLQTHALNVIKYLVVDGVQRLVNVLMDLNQLVSYNILALNALIISIVIHVKTMVVYGVPMQRVKEVHVEIQMMQVIVLFNIHVNPIVKVIPPVLLVIMYKVVDGVRKVKAV